MFAKRGLLDVLNSAIPIPVANKKIFGRTEFLKMEKRRRESKQCKTAEAKRPGKHKSFKSWIIRFRDEKRDISCVSSNTWILTAVRTETNGTIHANFTSRASEYIGRDADSIRPLWPNIVFRNSSTLSRINLQVRVATPRGCSHAITSATHAGERISRPNPGGSQCTYVV